jgi:hypothetical protein
MSDRAIAEDVSCRLSTLAVHVLSQSMLDLWGKIDSAAGFRGVLRYLLSFRTSPPDTHSLVTPSSTLYNFNPASDIWKLSGLSETIV